MSNKVNDLIAEETQELQDELKDLEKALAEDLKALQASMKWVNRDCERIQIIKNRINKLNEF